MAVAFPAAPKMTPEEFLLLDDAGVELIDGEVRSRNVSIKSSRTGTKFVRRLDVFAEDNDLGAVFGMDIGMQIFDHDPALVRKADCSFVRAGRLPDHDEGYLHVVPDLVVEVASPNDTAKEVLEKVQLWLDAGVRLVWVAYPGANQVHVYRRGHSASILSGDDELTGEDVLPGFRAPISVFFPD